MDPVTSGAARPGEEPGAAAPSTSTAWSIPLPTGSNSVAEQKRPEPSGQELPDGGEEDLRWVTTLRSGGVNSCNQHYRFIQDRVLPTLTLPPGVSREELLADTASNVWLSLKSLRDDSKFFSFVATIARRVTWKRRREAARLIPLPEDESRLPVHEPVAEGNAERGETLDSLSRSLRRSDEQLFKLLYVLGASTSEVRTALKVSPEILRKRKHRLNLRLRDAAGDKQRSV